MHRYALPLKFSAKLIERQIARFVHALAHIRGMPLQLAAANVTLPLRLKRTSRRLQFDQVVHKTWRNAEMPCSLSMAVAFLYKRNNAATQLNRMRFAHCGLSFQPQ